MPTPRLFTDIVEASLSGMVMFDRAGRITLVNREVERIFDYPRTDLIGQPIELLIPERFRVGGEGRRAEFFADPRRRVLGAGRDLFGRRRDGEEIPIEVALTPLETDEGLFVLASVLDITGRQNADRALVERAHVAELGADVGAALTQGATLIESLQGCCSAMVRHLDAAFARIWTLNVPDQVLELQASAGLYTHLDGPHSRVPVGKYKIGLIASERRPHLTNTVIGDPSIGDQEWAKREGMIAFAGYPLLVDGMVVGVVTMFARHEFTAFERDALGSVANNIAVAIARRRVQDDLSESERRARTSETYHRTILENIGDGVFIADHSGHFIDVNPGACTLTGYTREELVGMAVIDTYPPEQRGEGAERIDDVAGGLARSAERPLLRKDGRIVVVETNVRPLTGGHMVATVRDVTDRRHLEQQLRQSQKMEAVGRLAGGVAHDFNNLLTAIFGYAELASEALPADSSVRADITEIHKAAQRASTLTRQLLAFSRQQVLQPVVLSLNEEVEDIAKMLRRLIGEDVHLRLVLGTDVGNVRADPGQLQQVLLNLALNARDAMPSGGNLLIETMNAELLEHYAEMHPPVVPGPYVMLSVSDTGTGMSAETKSHIFEPFFTTKEKGKGTGLGLSTVYGIVKQSGGYVWVYSELGRGTTFKIYLPQVDTLAEPVTPRPEPVSLTGHETILLAEDDAALRPLAKALLQKVGYTVLDAATGDAALAVAGGHQGVIHLLVTDVVMPGTSGRDLARGLVAARPDTKVLFMSGYTDEAIVHHGMLEPGLNFLQKPFTPAGLARKVREVLDAV